MIGLGLGAGSTALRRLMPKRAAGRASPESHYGVHLGAVAPWRHLVDFLDMGRNMRLGAGFAGSEPSLDRCARSLLFRGDQVAERVPRITNGDAGVLEHPSLWPLVVMVGLPAKRPRPASRLQPCTSP